MTCLDLEFIALRWFRFEKACPYALYERSPRYGIGQPDVLGVTKAGFLLEIEIKRSLADFRADARKPHRAIRAGGEMADPSVWPKQFWYLVPPELANKVKPEIPEWAGLLRGPGRNESQQIISIVPAPTNKASSRLDVKEMLRLGHCMANQIYCQASFLTGWKHQSEYDWGLEYRI